MSKNITKRSSSGNLIKKFESSGEAILLNYAVWLAQTYHIAWSTQSWCSIWLEFLPFNDQCRCMWCYSLAYKALSTYLPRYWPHHWVGVKDNFPTEAAYFGVRILEYWRPYYTKGLVIPLSLGKKLRRLWWRFGTILLSFGLGFESHSSYYKNCFKMHG